MAKLTRIQLIVAAAYASIILCTFLQATLSTNEFRYRFIPAVVCGMAIAEKHAGDALW